MIHWTFPPNPCVWGKSHHHHHSVHSHHPVWSKTRKLLSKCSPDKMGLLMVLNYCESSKSSIMEPVDNFDIKSVVHFETKFLQILFLISSIFYINEHTHTWLITECLSTVILACLATVDWSSLKRMKLVHVSWSPSQKMIKKKVQAGNYLSSSMWGRSHHHHHSVCSCHPISNNTEAAELVFTRQAGTPYGVELLWIQQIINYGSSWQFWYKISGAFWYKSLIWIFLFWSL